MKKVLILILLVLFCAGSVFGGDFEDTFKKAKQGDAAAQYSVGVMYKDGDGTTQNYKQALYWYKKAANQGFIDAQFNLGVMYYHGAGTTQDHKQAFYWFKKSAEQGDVRAQFNLGFMYGKGEGTTQNYKSAYIWLSLAAAQGNKDATTNRDIAAKKLTPQQLSEAQELAAQMQEKIDSAKKP